MSPAAAFLLLSALAFPAAADDAFARCARGASLQSLDANGRKRLDDGAVFLDESRRDVAGSRYHMQYLYFTDPADPETLIAVFTQFEKHPAAFGQTIKSAGVTSRQKARAKVLYEERIPWPGVPKPRFTLDQVVSQTGAGAYRVDISLDSFENNSSHPSWYDAYLSAVPYRGGSLVVYCKYVVPANKTFPWIANQTIRGRMLSFPRELREWIRAETAAPAGLARAKSELKAALDPAR